MPKPTVEALINLHFFDPFVITTTEYEALHKEVVTHKIANDVTLADKIIATLLHNMEYRYNEAKAINVKRRLTTGAAR